MGLSERQGLGGPASLALGHLDGLGHVPGHPVVAPRVVDGAFQGKSSDDSVRLENFPLTAASAIRTSLDVSSRNGRCPIRSTSGARAYP
jgi:hypothetical protein